MGGEDEEEVWIRVKRGVKGGRGGWVVVGGGGCEEDDAEEEIVGGKGCRCSSGRAWGGSASCWSSSSRSRSWCAEGWDSGSSSASGSCRGGAAAAAAATGTGVGGGRGVELAAGVMEEESSCGGSMCEMFFPRNWLCWLRRHDALLLRRWTLQLLFGMMFARGCCSDGMRWR